MLHPRVLLPRGGRLGIAARFVPRPRSRRLIAAYAAAPVAVTIPLAHPAASTGGIIPRVLSDAASERRVRQVVDVVNRVLVGQLNCTLSLTLTADASSTTLVDARIGVVSALLFCPLSANAAAELAGGTLYVSSQNNGEATLAHANNSQADRDFRVVIIG